MKTVAEFAKEKGVSVQTIYRQLNNIRKTFNGGLTGVKQGLNDDFIEKMNGISYITALGEDALTERLTPFKQGLNDSLTGVKQPETEETAFYREQFQALQSELSKEREHSRALADKVANLAEQLAELSRNNQILLGAEQSRTNPVLLTTNEQPPDEAEQPIKKKGFWSLFKKH